MLTSASSTTLMRNIKESLLGTFYVFSFFHNFFFFNIDKVRFWLISAQEIVGLQNTQCITIFFLETFYFSNLLGQGFQKNLGWEDPGMGARRSFWLLEYLMLQLYKKRLS